jgi:MoxR-like ATPase
MKSKTDTKELERRVGEIAQRVGFCLDALGESFLGQRESLVEPLLFSILAGRHVLLEGLPGLGKTFLVKAVAASLGCRFSRIQCTPDLMPADVTGTEILEDRPDGGTGFHFREGPVFANLVLADELNRATPKTQSALLEAMEEGQVTSFGKTRGLPLPFSLIGTQNPVEMEGTYPLPEAQLDRFALCLEVPYPEDDILGALVVGPPKREVPRAVLDPAMVLECGRFSQEVLVADELACYVAAFCSLTQATPASGERMLGEGGGPRIRLGASPRAGIAILALARVAALVQGRFHVSREDVDRFVLPALRHRILLGFEAKARGITVEDMLPELRGKAWAKARKRC